MGSVFSGPLAELSAQQFETPRPIKIDGVAEQPLRWKAKPIAVPLHANGEVRQATGYSPINTAAIGSGVVQASDASDLPTNATPPSGWNKMRIDSYVTPAQATQPIHSPPKADPFADPFNDRRATQAAALQLQGPGGGNVAPNTNQPGVNPANPGFNPGVPPAPVPNFAPPAFQPPAAPNLNPAPLQPADPGFAPPNRFDPPAQNPLPSPQAPELQDPAPPRTQPEETDPAPDPQPGIPKVRGSADNNSPSNKDCERKYGPNGELNCCDTDANCRAFIQSLMRDRLNSISLDISPKLEPDKDDNENELIRADRSRLSGVREWYGRGVRFEDRSKSQAIAVGRLHDLLNGRVIIMQESGQTRDIPLNDLSEDDLCFVSGWWRLPAECAIAGHRDIDRYNRGWMPSTVAWHASALCHKPLYFEQVQHERYGHSAGPFRQPFVDGAHFFGSAIMLPYKMALDAPWECEYALGYYRPGSCAPYHIPPFPFSPRAAMAQAGFVVGGIYVIP